MTTVNDRQCGFVEGTAVLMATGHLKPIEKIEPGDWVMSFDTTSADSALEAREVIDVFKYISRDVLEVKSDQDSLMVAPGQLFLTPGMDWTFAQETAYIIDDEGNDRSFEVKKINVGKQRIYDIIVDDNHSLVANGFRVHNGVDGTPERGATGSASNNSYGGLATGRSLGTPEASANRNEARESNRDPVSRGSFGFTNGDEGGFRSGGGGNDNGGRGDRQSVQVRSSRNTKPKAEPKKVPPPDAKAVANAAYSAIQDTMDYICDILVQATTTNFFTVRTAAFRYMTYARALAADALVHVGKSDMSAADKATLRTRDNDLVNGFTIIENAFKGDPNQAVANIESISRACLNNKMWIDMQQGIIGKYIGSAKSDISYVLPGYTPPAKVNLQSVPQNRAYVQTAPGIYVTTTPSPVGTTTVQPTTGGLGASFTKTRVVRGFLYSYTPNKGWAKIGPADQKTNWL